MKQIPTIDKLKNNWGINPQSLGMYFTEDKNSIIDNQQELLGPERKISVDCRSILE